MVKRSVAVQTEMRDARIDPPENGTRVHALSIGGTMAQTIWTSQSHLQFEAWHDYLKVPESVKKRMLERYKLKTETAYSDTNDALLGAVV